MQPQHLWSHIFWLCLAFLFLGFTAAAVLTDGQSTLREWMGALSGWVAAAAAGITVFYIRRSLFVSSEQTAIMSGEIRPTFSYELPIENQVGFAHRFAVFNDSKYRMRVLEIAITSPGAVTMIPSGQQRNLGHQRRDWPIEAGQSVHHFRTDFRVNAGFGQEERSRFAFVLVFFENGEQYVGPIELKATYTLDGFGPNDRREMICDETLIEPNQ